MRTASLINVVQLSDILVFDVGIKDAESNEIRSPFKLAQLTIKTRFKPVQTKFRSEMKFSLSRVR